MKQLQKLVKVRYVEDITDAERVGKQRSTNACTSQLCVIACLTCVTCRMSSVLTVSGLQCACRHLLAEDLNSPTMLSRGMSAFDVNGILCRAGAGTVED